MARKKKANPTGGAEDVVTSTEVGSQPVEKSGEDPQTGKNVAAKAAPKSQPAPKGQPAPAGAAPKGTDEPAPKSKNKKRKNRNKNQNLQEQRKSLYAKMAKSVEELCKEIFEGVEGVEDKKKRLHEMIDELATAIDLQQKLDKEKQAMALEANLKLEEAEVPHPAGEVWSQVKSKPQNKEGIKKWTDDMNALVETLHKAEVDAIKNISKQKNLQQQSNMMQKLIKAKKARDPNAVITAHVPFMTNVDVSADLMSVLFYPLWLARKLERQHSVAFERKTPTSMSIKATTVEDLNKVSAYIQEINPNGTTSVIAKIALEKGAARVIIGRAGSTVRKIEEMFEVVVMTESSNTNVVILGSAKNVEKAQAHIQELLEENKNSANMETVYKPLFMARILLQNEAKLVKVLEKASNCHVKVALNPDNKEAGPNQSQLMLRGKPEDIETCKTSLDEVCDRYATAEVPIEASIATRLFGLNTRSISEKPKPNEDTRTALLRQLKHLRDHVVMAKLTDKMQVAAEKDKVEEYAKTLEDIIRQWKDLPEDVVETTSVEECAIQTLIDRKGQKLREVEEAWSVNISLEKAKRTIKYRGKRESIEGAMKAIKAIEAEIVAKEALLVTHEYPLEQRQVRIVIGVKGASVNNIRKESQVNAIQVVDKPTSLLRIKGQPESVQIAVKMIDEILANAKVAEAAKETVAAVSPQVVKPQPTEHKSKKKQQQPDVESVVSFPALGGAPKKSPPTPPEAETEEPAVLEETAETAEIAELVEEIVP
eukprot:Platyproteum_vivax@DN2928_c0_g1_i1.p1